MAHVGQEGALGPVRVLGNVLGLLQGLAGFLQACGALRDHLLQALALGLQRALCRRSLGIGLLEGHDGAGHATDQIATALLPQALHGLQVLGRGVKVAVPRQPVQGPGQQRQAPGQEPGHEEPDDDASHRHREPDHLTALGHPLELRAHALDAAQAVF